MSGDNFWRHGALGRFGQGGALIDPAAIPELHYDTGGLHADAARLRSLGGKVAASAGKINKRWQGGLPEHYDAPELGDLTAGMSRVVSKATHVRTDLEAAGEALTALASAVDGAMQTLEWLRGQASAFRAWALNFTEDSTLAHKTPKDWRTEIYPVSGRHGHEENLSLCNQVGDTLDAVLRAEQACVSALEGHTDTTALPAPEDLPPVRPFGNGALRADDAAAARAYGDWRRLGLTGGANLPWGGIQSLPKERIDVLTKVIAGFLDSTVISSAKYAAGFLGLSFVTARDPAHRGQLGLKFSVKTFKQTMSANYRMFLAGQPTSYLDAGQRRQNIEIIKGIGTSFVASDEKDGAVRTGKILGNVWGLVGPSPVKGAGIAHALETVSAKGARIAEHGGFLGKAAGTALRVPELAANGKWIGLDVRLAGKALGAGVDLAQHRLPTVGHLLDRARGLDPGHLVHDADAATGPAAGISPARGSGDAVPHATDWAAREHARLSDRYHEQRAALHQQRLDALRHAPVEEHPRITDRFDAEQRSLKDRFDADRAGIGAEAERRIGAAHRTGLSTGSAAHDAARIDDLVSRHPDAAGRSHAVRDYVDHLTAEERTALAHQHPDLVRSLRDAVPPQMYADANRARAERDLAALLGKVGPDHERVAALKAMLAPYRDPVTGRYGEPTLLRYDPAEGRAVVAYGDLATAERRAIFVPGMFNNLDKFPGFRQSIERWLADGARADAHQRTAMIAWLGYQPPAGVGGLHTRIAQRAASDLHDFVDGLRRQHPGGETVLVAHSYGTLVGRYAIEHGARFDSVAFLGSPGVGRDLENLLHLPAAPGHDRVFWVNASRDPIAWTGWHAAPQHGVHVDATGGTGHKVATGYAAGDTSKSIGAIIAGRYDQVREALPPLLRQRLATAGGRGLTALVRAAYGDTLVPPGAGEWLSTVDGPRSYPHADPAHNAFQQAWARLPEPVREQALGVVLWQNGPINTTGKMPGEMIWPQPPNTAGAQPSYQAAVAFLQRHPDLAIVEYLRRHPLAVPVAPDAPATTG
ncbi:alpha/beta hydrolase [Micromonospora sp. NPDC049559]|uniref:alpha/beta hydrolase n=1 Tax=Micromonospora sp. NPDC049559 TaxID=3155923 RepID=UPI003423B121